MLAFYIAQIEDQSDKQKFTQLYELYQQSMFKVAYCILRNETQAEDAVHEAFLYLIGVIHKFQDPAAPATERYVLKVAKHKAIDMLRAKNTEQRALEQLQRMEDAESSVRNETMHRLEQREQDSAIKQCILSLPEEEQELMKLLWFSKMTVSEIASLYHISKKTVYNRKKALLDKLKQDLEKRNFFV